MYAHYFATKARKVLVLTRGIRLQEGLNRIAEIEVSGKTEARRIAAERSALPWNF